MAALLLSLNASAGFGATETMLSSPVTTRVAQVEFDDGFLNGQADSRINISRFNQGNVALPGTYLVEILVNGLWFGRAELTLRQTSPDVRSVQPCMTRDLLERASLDLNRLTPEAAGRLANTASCPVLAELVEDASAAFDAGEQRLELSIPQLALVRSPRGYVGPKYWDDGVPAMILQYNASLYRNQNPGGISSTQGYAGLSLGLNAGPWRLRHSGSYTHSNAFGQTASGYQSVQTNLQRAIAPLNSQLILGEAFTDGALFDSVGFRGVRLASDDRMFPESQRGYAPVVRGLASSNARVRIRQNGNLLYETTVAPGPFEINDLYPTGYGGDLQVTVTEANGKTSAFTVPYAAAVGALRPGVTRFSLTAGQYRSPTVRMTPYLAQGTAQHGFTNLLTGYGGLTLSEGYAAALVGLALNTDYGAFGLDLTHARTALPNLPQRSGQSLRLAYTKLIAPTNTNLTLAAFHFSSPGYLHLSDAVVLHDLARRSLATGELGIPHTQLQLTLTQTLAPGYGSFYFSGSSMNYWNRTRRDTQFQAGYDNSYRYLTYGIAASRQLNTASAQWDNRLMLTLGFPLGPAAHAPYASTSVQHDLGRGASLQQSLSGTLGADNTFSYGLNASRVSGNGGPSTTSVGANTTYAISYTTLNASASQGNHYNQQGAGTSGTLVAYGGGLAFSPSSGDTYAVVEATDAAGARLASASGARISPWGRALSTSLTPFARNPVTLDPEGLPLSVELKATEQQAIPTAGAVVRVRFETANTGRTAVFQASTAAGHPLPYGAEVTDSQGTPVGTVSQAGRFIARGLPDDHGRLTITWGTRPDERCAFDYQLPPADKTPAAGLPVIQDICRDPASPRLLAKHPPS
ncbi:Outer membrane usher protein HtrE [Paraburkholderia aspalathi]|uniref:Outer membrane usher protein HtrE n=1 Tax=Paraburkholderia aspalathi TaxID=1324617 RepID=A0ABM8T3M0_9BURK|nr:fimbria/pilus outer membrane usher protein [Paraburkholderia aspalathi]MBK3823795.1 fimbrial biogenesis outer membrane usher protein [Paraburkholderia aspalathi]MBK3835645.1 fimbrial biogenesis outer membrane usher protein [Paraburkholderia aspalathi]MBK3865396.1 fimbrial biogenesis outer membrane usher protein [Paraburkholderia aspalathi]CAE6853980.1 Outer membrane usher protein HtrE [Paraburkholderia aspalathi]